MKLELVLKEHVIKILSSCKTKNEAANVLGVTPKTLRNYLDRWGMSFEERRNTDDKIYEDSYRNLTPEERDRFENMDRL